MGQAPRLTVRLRADIRDFLLGHAEGARGLIERLVEQERQGTGRIQSLEKRLAELQEQLTAAQSVEVLASREEQLSDNRVVPPPGPLEGIAARFRENFRNHSKARSLARQLGLKKDDQLKALGVGYCGTRGAARDAAEQKEFKKLGLVERNGRESLAGCLTLPFFATTGALSGLWGCHLKTRAERRVGMGQGLLATGPLGEELVLVDGVVEALAAFGSGISGVQAMELLTPGWFPSLRQAGVRKVWLALAVPEQMHRMASELARAGMDCWLVEVPEDRESRVDLLEYPASWKIALKQARRYAPTAQREKNTPR